MSTNSKLDSAVHHRVERFYRARRRRQPGNDLTTGVTLQIIDAEVRAVAQEDVGRIQKIAPVP